MSEPVKKVRLSASAIECIDSCSWLYFVKYIQKLPEFEDPALARGNIAHEIFELLHAPKHKQTVLDIIETKKLTKPLIRLIRKNCNKKGLVNEEEKDLVCSLVKVGLLSDFFCSGASKIESEQKFVIETDSYVFTGFIDRRAFIDEKTILVRDFKSSKKKFKDEKINSNVQAIAYSLHTYKETGIIPKVEFVFLRFSKSPIQEAPIATEEQLRGFEYYLEHLAGKVSLFNEEEAKKDFAKNSESRCWLCKMGTWRCRFLNPFDYFVLIREGKDYRKALTEKELVDQLKEGDKIEARRYDGCPAWAQERENEKKDFFDL